MLGFNGSHLGFVLLYLYKFIKWSSRSLMFDGHLCSAAGDQDSEAVHAPTYYTVVWSHRDTSRHLCGDGVRQIRGAIWLHCWERTPCWRWSSPVFPAGERINLKALVLLLVCQFIFVLFSYSTREINQCSCVLTKNDVGLRCKTYYFIKIRFEYKIWSQNLLVELHDISAFV